MRRLGAAPSIVRRPARLPGHRADGGAAGRGRASSAASAPSCAEPWEPGLHWGLPWGLDRVDRIKTGQTRTLTVGARDPQAAPLAQAPDPETDDFLTGDLNLVTAQAIVQYRVLDPVALPVRRPLGRRDPGGGGRVGADRGPWPAGRSTTC